MPRRAAHDESMRLFVAAYPPAELVDAWGEALGAVELPEYRATPAEQVHLTLQFIGDTARRELDSVLESVERSCAGLEAFALTPLRLMTLPERGRARLVAVETDAPAALMELHKRLAHRLAKNVREAGRRGDFRPHLTLCRFTRGGPGGGIDVPLGGDAGAPFAVRDVLLMRSVLSNEGARHAEVARFLMRCQGV